MSPSASVPLVGGSASAQPGSVGVSAAVPLTGVQAVASPGTVGAGLETVGVEAPTAAGNVGVNITIALTGVGGVAQVGSLGSSIQIPISGIELVTATSNMSPRVSVLLTSLGITVVPGSVTGPAHDPPVVVLTNALNNTMKAPPSSQNPYTAGRKIAHSYCDWVSASRSILGAPAIGVTTTGYLKLANELGRVLSMTSGFINTAAPEFAEAFTSMWRYSGVIFGNEPVVACYGTQDLAKAVSGMEPLLLRRAGFGEDLYPSWLTLAQALADYTARVYTASGPISPPA